jgi:broad specificity phosphatase PhoE
MTRPARHVAIVVVTCLCGPIACAQGVAKPRTYPARVLIIRHAEKSNDALSKHLNEAGKERAAALPKLFEKSDDRPGPFPKPDYILAARNSANSHRPVETVTPLAKALKLTVTAEIDSDDVPAFARQVFFTPKYEGKTLLISWRHGMLPELAKALGAADAPKDWKDETFDRVWDLTFDEQGKVTFRDRPMHLMPGDAKK